MKRFLPLFALLLGLVFSCKEKPDPEKPVEMLLNNEAVNLEYILSCIVTVFGICGKKASGPTGWRAGR